MRCDAMRCDGNRTRYRRVHENVLFASSDRRGRFAEPGMPRTVISAVILLFRLLLPIPFTIRSCSTKIVEWLVCFSFLFLLVHTAVHHHGLRRISVLPLQGRPVVLLSRIRFHYMVLYCILFSMCHYSRASIITTS